MIPVSDVSGVSPHRLQRWLCAKRYLFLTAPAVPLLLPLAAWLALARGHGGWLWLPFLVLFILVPLLDTLCGEDPANPGSGDVATLAADPWYRRVLFAAVATHWLGVLFMAGAIAHGDWAWHSVLGAALGAGAINGLALLVGHELGHKTRDPVQSAMARIVLAVTGYGHFSVEHNQGHHKQVSTPEDSASARYGESIYAFARREIPGALRRGWALERGRLAALGLPAFSPHNPILQSWGLTVAGFGLATVFWGWSALAFLLLAAGYGWWQLTSANYVEHYGLLREKLADGHYESCRPKHSWNSNLLLSNLLLLHLQRHSDHHAYPMRPYQLLRDYRDVPQLPHGYALMFTVAAIPPLWFALMNPRVMAWAGGDINKVNRGPLPDPAW
jgi:alkane 1-monooxygenase